METCFQSIRESVANHSYMNRSLNIITCYYCISDRAFPIFTLKGKFYVVQKRRSTGFEARIF